MRHSWQSLMRIVNGQKFRIERVRLQDSGITVEGEFSLPPLAALSEEDQLFAAAFLASHGSIKKMESLFGVSYPTVKNRLNRIASQLDVPRVDIGPMADTESRAAVLERLDRGEISFDDAMEELK